MESSLYHHLSHLLPQTKIYIKKKNKKEAGAKRLVAMFSWNRIWDFEGKPLAVKHLDDVIWGRNRFSSVRRGILTLVGPWLFSYWEGEDHRTHKPRCTTGEYIAKCAHVTGHAFLVASILPSCTQPIAIQWPSWPSPCMSLQNNSWIGPSPRKLWFSHNKKMTATI